MQSKIHKKKWIKYELKQKMNKLKLMKKKIAQKKTNEKKFHDIRG
jgi:hypothetical protein